MLSKFNNVGIRQLYKNKTIRKYFKNIIDKFNPLEYPYISFNDSEDTFDINEDVIINFYATDYSQSDVLKSNTNIKFKAHLNINNQEFEKEIFIGDNYFNVGKLPKGEYPYIISIQDSFNRKSHNLYNELRVINKAEYEADIISNTYNATVDDLVAYNISLGDYSERTTINIDIAHNNKMGLQDLFNEMKRIGYKKIVLPNGIYTIDAESVWTSSNSNNQYTVNILTIPTKFTVDLNNSILKQLTSETTQRSSLMFAINNCYDSHIVNGIIEGDYGLREFKQAEGRVEYISGEQSGCCRISGDSKYCSLENVTIRKFAGYTVGTGVMPTNCLIQNEEQTIIDFSVVLKFEQGTIENGIEKEADYMHLTQFLDLEKFKNKGVFRLGSYLGTLYQPHGDSAIIKCHFYDKNKEYLKTTTEHQYRDILIPQDAQYVKGEYMFKDFTNNENMTIYYMGSPRNCTFKNIIFEDTRTCALAPTQGNSIKIDGCTFARCATNITPVAIDLEDGWHNMQDYCIKNCEILEPVGTGDLVVVGGFNLIFKDNTNWRVFTRGYSRGMTFKNNTLSVLNTGFINHRLSAYSRILDNIFNSGTYLNSLATLEEDLNISVNDCVFYDEGVSNLNKGVFFNNCLFDAENLVLTSAKPILQGLNYYNSTFNNFNTTFGNVVDFEAHRTTINNMVLGALQGSFILTNSVINKCSFKHTNKDVNIKLTNCTLNDFYFNKGSYNININIELENCIINNTDRSNILDDNWSWWAGGKEFIVKVKNCTFENNSKIANDSVLANSNITFIKE